MKSFWPESMQSQRYFKVLSAMRTIPRLQKGDSILKNNKAVGELNILELILLRTVLLHNPIEHAFINPYFLTHNSHILLYNQATTD